MLGIVAKGVDTEGVGGRVIVNVCACSVHPFKLGVAAIFAVSADFVRFIAVIKRRSPEPLKGKPMAAKLFVQSKVVPSLSDIK